MQRQSRMLGEDICRSSAIPSSFFYTTEYEEPTQQFRVIDNVQQPEHTFRVFRMEGNPPMPNDWRGKYRTVGAQKVFAVLSKFYEAIEDGTVSNYTPDPLYKWKGKAPDDLVALLDAIDQEFYKEMRVRNAGTWEKFDAEPEFHRLLDIDGGAPAWALAQALDEALDCDVDAQFVSPEFEGYVVADE